MLSPLRITRVLLPDCEVRKRETPPWDSFKYKRTGLATDVYEPLSLDLHKPLTLSLKLYT